MNVHGGSYPTLRFVIGLAAAIGMIATAAASIHADNDGDRDLRAVPFVFVGDEGDCGQFPPGSGRPYPAGARVVTSAWLGGAGLPDNGDTNVGVNPTNTPNKNDPRLGLLLSKNASSLDCSVAGAEIRGIRRLTVDPAFVLGFDYRNGSHCGEGPETGSPAGGASPRFRVVVENALTGTTTEHSVSNCQLALRTPAQQDGNWITVTWTAAQALPPIPPGSTVRSITVLFDAGTDRASASDPNGVGLAVIDNININGEIIRTGNGIAPRGRGDGDGQDNQNR